MWWQDETHIIAIQKCGNNMHAHKIIIQGDLWTLPTCCLFVVIINHKCTEKPQIKKLQVHWRVMKVYEDYI